MKKIMMLLTVVVFAAACGQSVERRNTLSADTAIPLGNSAVIFNANYGDPVGSISIIDTGDYTKISEAIMTTDGSDAVVRSFDGKIYVINRFGADTIQVIDLNESMIVADFSVGGGSNPQDIVVVSDEKAYVSRLSSENDDVTTDDVLIVNPKTGEILGGIDLKPYTTDDGERFARAAQMVLVDKYLYVCMQDLPKNMRESANTNGKVAIVNTETDEIVDADPNAEGVQVIELAGRNPYDITYSPETKKFYVANTGVFVNFVVDTANAFGGIEVIDEPSKKTLGVVMDDALFGGYVTEVRFASATAGFAIVNSNTIVSFNPTTYEMIHKNLYASPYFLPDFSIDENGRLWIAEQDINNPGIVIIDADGPRVAGPIKVGALPVSITFVDADL